MLPQGGGTQGRSFLVAEKIFEGVRPELLKAQTHLARLRLENWLTFITFLRGHFEGMGKLGTGPGIEDSSRGPAKVSSIAGIHDGK
jgi:hypothetical protein